jgi:hypothetical protein
VVKGPFGTWPFGHDGCYGSLAQQSIPHHLLILFQHAGPQKSNNPSTASAQTLPEPNIPPFHLGKNT